MRHLALLLGAALFAAPLPASAQSGPTQSRDGLGNAAHPTQPANGSPAGSENANTGPQGRPAFPRGSTTANPGGAFVRNQPRPATGPLASPPGNLGTTTVTPGGGVVQQQPGSPGVGAEGPGRPQTPR